MNMVVEANFPKNTVMAAGYGFGAEGDWKHWKQLTDKIGDKVGDLAIRDVKELVTAIRSEEIKIAMLAVPAATAQQVADKLVEAGIKAILNYAPVSLSVPSHVRVQYIDPAIGLQRMTYYLD